MARLFLSPPYMGGMEQKYIQDAFAQNWIAPLGPNVDGFENEMKERLGCGFALALSSGTAAIHLALRYLNVEAGDYVFCSSMSFIGSSVPIDYMGATPVFIDSEPDTWNMSPLALKRALQWAKSQNKLPKAVIIVDLYGHPADYDALLPLCREYDTPVIEDAAEALGAGYMVRPCGKSEPCGKTRYCGYYKPCGTMGDYGILSFNGNKIITTSGGGMLLMEDEKARSKTLFWATQARDKAIHYEHTEYGYNYRMSNVCAGIGRGQLEILDYKLERRAAIHAEYTKLLDGTRYRVKQDCVKAKSNHWLTVALVRDSSIEETTGICEYMSAHDIETRPAWKPLHMQPLYSGAPAFSHNGTGEAPDRGGFVCEELFDAGICLPSGDAMDIEEQSRVVELLIKAAK